MVSTPWCFSSGGICLKSGACVYSMCDWSLFEFGGYTTASFWKNCCWSLNHFPVQKNTHEETSFCVKNISKLSVWKRFWKSLFSFSVRDFPEDNEFDCLNKHRKCVLVLACSAVFHMVFPIEGTLMVGTQLWSMCSYQYFSLCSSACVSIAKSQSIRDKLDASFLWIF